MFRFIKKPVFIFIFVILCVASPLYAAYRIAAPNFLLKELEKKLPKGAQLSVKTIFSRPNLEIVYQGIQLTSDSGRIDIPQLTVKPVLDLEKPIFVLVDEFVLQSDFMKMAARGIETSILLSGFNVSNLGIEGKFEQINSLEEAVISHGDFIIAGINSSSKQLDLSADVVELTSKTPEGVLKLKLFDTQHSFIFDNSISGETFSDEVNVDFIPFAEGLIPQKFSGIAATVNFSLNKEKSSESWVLPINFMVKSIYSHDAFLFQSLGVKAKGKWTGQNILSCGSWDIFNGTKKCGKMTDVLDADVLLQNGAEMIHFYGNGYCVSPQSGCRQVIDAHLESRATEKVFLRLLETQTINPLILSVLMGTLLASPSYSSNVDHKVDINVNGSEILFNDKALF